ncbi:MAG TPA: YDG domain-containing protein [Mucilaginibacter sp.]|nr:YDG domain-containing protein [Mucilaginibacter sp.]
MTTTYGTSSSNGAFSVSGTNMSAGITVTAPVGFEVSTNSGGPFSGSILVGSAGTISATTIYVRLAATTTPGSYSGNVSCSSSGATTRNIAIGSSTVNKAVLTISGLTGNSKTYDRTTGATISGTATLNGVIGSDVVTLGGTPSATFASASVGTGITITVTGYTIGGANAAYYTLTQPTGLTANITAKTLTVSGAVASNKQYDGTTNATVTGGTLAGVIAPDVVSLSPTGTFSSPNAGTGIGVTVSLSGADAGNYTLSQPGITANITLASLTITANNVSKVYGTTIAGGSGSTAFTATGLQNGETVGSVIILYWTGSTSTDAVGTYNGSVTVQSATGGTFSASNYSITYVPGNITVTQATLTITGLSGVNKVYDGTTTASLTGTATLSGVMNGDAVSLSGTPAATFAVKNVGTGIVITVSGYTLTGANAGNYTLSQPTGLTANITPKALTISGASASNKVYDGTTTAKISGTLCSCVIGSDAVTLTLSGTFATKNVGTGIAVTSTSTLSGADAGNYTLTQPAGLTANITPATLTITGIIASDKSYDGTTAATISGSATLNGIVSGDAVTLGGTPAAVFASQNVGTGISVTITGYAISGTSSGNYVLTQPSGFTANITTAPLVIVATGPLKVTGFGSPVITGDTTDFTYYGTVNGETITSITTTPNPTTTQTTGSTYTVTPSAAAGANGYLASNYSITYKVYNGVVAGYSYVWTGATSTDWSTSTNWSPNGVPGTTDNVSIPCTVNTPTVNKNSAVNTITFTGNNTLTITANNKLVVNSGVNINSGLTSVNLAFSGTSPNTTFELKSAILTNYSNFSVLGNGILQVDNTGSFIYNSGTFTAGNNVILYLQGGSNILHAITNAGTFYAGTSGSACYIEMDDYGSIENAGKFYLGPTSQMYYYNDRSQNVIVNNESGATFTLQSDATGSATIGEIPQGLNDVYTGVFTVERYFQGGNTYSGGRWVERAYRVISSCINNGTPVNGNSVFGLNYIVGPTAGQTTTANSLTNAFITGCTGGSTSAGNPSVYLYNEKYTPSNATYVSGNFLGVTNITNSTTGGTLTTSDGNTYSLPVGTGVLFFFRGAATNWSTRTVYPYIAPESVTLTTTGYLNTGPYTFKDYYTPTSSNLAYTGTGTGTNYAVRGFNMIGNPYPSGLDWQTSWSGLDGIIRTNIAPTIWVFNPVTYQWDTYMETSTSGGTATGNASRYIASGQGFIVQATATGASLTIDEYAKTTQNNNGSVSKVSVPAGANPTGPSLLMSKAPMQDGVQQSLRLKLGLDSISYDDIYIGFNPSASPGYDSNEDAAYLPGLGAAVGLASISSDNVRLSINNLQLPNQATREIKLFVTASKSGIYTLKRTDIEGIPQVYDVWLMDKFKKDSLDIRQNANYTFNINLSDTASFGSNRFSIVIRQSPGNAVKLLSFAGEKALSGARVTWTTQNEQNYTYFTVERSTDNGATFTVLGTTAPDANGKYTFLDKSPQMTTDIYRLRLEDASGAITYSNQVPLKYTGDMNTTMGLISVYPNPAQSTINLNISSANTLNHGNKLLFSGKPIASVANKTVYNIKIINASGVVVKSESTTLQSWQADVKNLLPGTYVMQVYNSADNSLMGRGTFVKL